MRSEYFGYEDAERVSRADAVLAHSSQVARESDGAVGSDRSTDCKAEDVLVLLKDADSPSERRLGHCKLFKLVSQAVRNNADMWLQTVETLELRPSAYYKGLSPETRGHVW